MSASNLVPNGNDSETQRELKAMPFRMTIEQAFAVKGRGVIVAGRVETGMLRRGDEVLIFGNKRSVKAQVNRFELLGLKGEFVAEPGDNIGFSLKGVNMDDVEPGMVVSAA